MKLARWLVQQKLPGTAKLTVPSGKSELVDALGELRRKKKLKCPLGAIRGLVGDAVDVNLAFTEARISTTHWLPACFPKRTSSHPNAISP